ncbi:MAG: bifunctional phosphopantothenoylcysteine decarboxylase/phosphopantothenate--cysteine ligase CoaBC [Gracilibacteraceae bacterium]|jgi:phosphopantothenoylcysteine decarboxylase/phosphopantothenate--cysteine ligase|nr:bifunctional phosphopantothenoylcysteine decarboxylase/phosphopantothenate--cysteine ligase CoaBC [Gracilibacteraceae bacterium]
MLTGKKIILGVTGGIAAYKAVELASRLKKDGAELRVVMTEAAAAFVRPLTFQAVSGNPVHLRQFEEPRVWNIEHVALAEQADLIVVAPATAHTLACMALGLAPDLLTSTLLAARSPILAAPAMNTAMYFHPATQEHLACLRARGVALIGPDEGALACGESGAGRMSEPEAIAAAARRLLTAGPLAGRRALVTAGGTRERLDPVRYIGNFSSGKMGYAAAASLAAAGAEVTLISAPTALPRPAGVRRIETESALAMRDAVLELFPASDIAVMAAAVADYRPAAPAEQKIKKKGGDLTLTLTETPDILAELGRQKQGKVLVGFAAETEDARARGAEKLRRKNADFLVLNDVTRAGAGFGADTNIVSFLYPGGGFRDFPLMSKREVADLITEEIIRLLPRDNKPVKENEK